MSHFKPAVVAVKGIDFSVRQGFACYPDIGAFFAVRTDGKTGINCDFCAHGYDSLIAKIETQLTKA